MKDQDTILTLEETEELCRRYMDCQLSVLEEKELQYILSYLPYSSPVIQEARESMSAEGLLSLYKKPEKRRRFTLKRIFAGIAASAAVVVLILTLLPNHTHSDVIISDNLSRHDAAYSDCIVIAYEDGKRLNHEDALKAAKESEKKIDEFFAMAEAKKKETEQIQNYILNLTSNVK